MGIIIARIFKTGQVIYSLPNKAISGESKKEAGEKFKHLADTLHASFDKLKQLAVATTVRRSQLILHHLASQVYKSNLQIIAQMQSIENRMLQYVRHDSASGEWRVIPFLKLNKPDNTGEILSQCKTIKMHIQQAYKMLLDGKEISDEQRKILKNQLTNIQEWFLKLSLTD